MIGISHNKKENILYLVPTRNGSKTIAKISASSKFPQIVTCHHSQVRGIVADDPDIRIIAVYRSPIIRFKSGLKIARHKFNNLEFLKIYLETINVHGLIPYHLYDPHLTHCLMLLCIPAINGYNAEFLDTNLFSDHLSLHYSGWESIDNMQQDNVYRTMSNSPDIAGCEEYWDQYVLWMKEHGMPTKYSWQDWMQPEINLYECIRTIPTNSPSMPHLASAAAQYLKSDTVNDYSILDNQLSNFIYGIFPKKTLPQNA